MLVRLTDTKDQPVWVNPIHVKAVRPKSKYTEVFVPLNSSFGTVSIKVKGTPEEIVDALNAGMPDLLPPLPPEDDASGGGFAGGAGAAALMG